MTTTRHVGHAESMVVRCLIVDDNEDFLHAARALLEREGISVVATASNGAQAVRACRQLKPEVALVDVDLGAETGFDIARRLAGQAGPGLPRVILVSASTADDLADLVAESPAISFLYKADLSAIAIHAILENADAPAPQRDSR